MSALAFLAIACEGEESLPTVPVSWEGAYVAFGASPGLEACAGTPPAIDASVGLLLETFNYPDPAERIEVRWLDEEAYTGSPCTGTACAVDTTVLTTVVPINHEVVHAVHNGFLGAAYRPLAFDEGIAEYFGDDIPYPDPSPKIEPLLEQTSGFLEPEDYPRVGHFASFLSTRRGSQQYNAFLDAATGVRSYEQVREAFRQTFMVSLEAEIASYYADYPECSRNNWREPLVECDSQSQPWDDGSENEWSFSSQLDCGDAESLGPRYGKIWTTRTLEISNAGMFRFRQAFRPEGPPGVSAVKFVRCDATCESPFELVLEDTSPIDGTADAFAPAGRYYVQLERDETADVEVTALVNRLE